jgi:hypothetical protein
VGKVKVVLVVVLVVEEEEDGDGIVWVGGWVGGLVVDGR